MTRTSNSDWTGRFGSRTADRVVRRRFRFMRGSTAVAVSTLAGFAAAQSQSVVTYSIDYSSATLALPDSFTGTPITEGDILAPQLLFPAIGPLFTPGILESAGFLAPQGLGLAGHLGCVGHLPGTPCSVDVDALSHGMDRIVLPTPPGPLFLDYYAFSVNRRSVGSTLGSFPPDVPSEGVCFENTADVYHTFPMPIAPVPPMIGGHNGLIDGNGLINCTGSNLFPGLGLQETPVGMLFPDNLDALDLDVPDAAFPRTTCSFFSLDGAFLDPITLILGSGSAAAHGFRPGDILRTLPGGLPTVYATANQLGLDLAPSLPNSDDVDGLILWENGIDNYQRSTTPYDWTSGASDMLFFSVRRGSALIGQPDAFFGLPIEPGDILTPTGALGTLPGIWIAAEALALNTTRTGLPPFSSGDDVDAIDAVHQTRVGTSYCPGDGTGTACPCGNSGFSGRGCGNSQNGLGAILWANGMASISFDTVSMNISGQTAVGANRLFQGTTPFTSGIPFGDGLRCVGGSVIRFPIRNALCGNRSFGYGIPGDPSLSAYFGVAPGTYYYQVQYRDIAPTFCTTAVFNFSNGLSVVWGP